MTATKTNGMGVFPCALVGFFVGTCMISGAARGQQPAPNDMFPQWSHDGKSIVFMSDRDGDPEIYVMRTDGTDPVRLTHAPGRDAHPRFSRDGRKIIFQSPRANGEDTNIYVMDSDGSNAVRLTNLKGFAGVPVYSPDESLIVFQWRESNNFDDDRKWRIGVMHADGSHLRVITPGEANDQVPTWSRDGRRLLFFSDRTGRNQIYTMKPDGSDVRRLAVTDFDDNAASWSPDNKRIAFTSERDGNGDLYVMDADGRNVRRLTHTPATERAPAWSPDGQRISFCSDGDGPGEIYAINADGSNLVRLTGRATAGEATAPAAARTGAEPQPRANSRPRAEPQRVLWEDGVKNAYPHWSRDGSRLLFQSNRGSRWQIQVMDRDGAHPEQLTHGDSNNNFPDWSPDNAAIAFVSDRDGNEEIYVMNAGGGDPRRVTRSPARDIHPYWSTDGTKILFSSTRDGDKFQIYEATPDGKTVRRLVTSDDDDTCARVSPQGDRIVYLTNLASGRDDVIVRRRDGSAPVNITDDAPADGWPTWTPDGRRILFASKRGGPFALYVMDSDGSHPRPITSPPAGYADARPNVSPDGKRIVFNREQGETIGIFVLDLEQAHTMR